MPEEEEKEMEERFYREAGEAEAWVDMVVDIVGELEDLFESDGYGADNDEEESKGGASFREDMDRIEAQAMESFEVCDGEYTMKQSSLHDEFRRVVEGRVEQVLSEKKFNSASFVDRLKEVEDLPGWSWARDTTKQVVDLLRQVDSFQVWASGQRQELFVQTPSHHHKNQSCR